MRQAEFDIITDDGTYCNEMMEVDSNADLTDIITAARQLLGICHWQKVRVGVGSQLSNWITSSKQHEEHTTNKRKGSAVRKSH